MKHHIDTSDLDKYECCQEGAMRRASADADAPDLYCDPQDWRSVQGRYGQGEPSDELPSVKDAALALAVAGVLVLACVALASWLALLFAGGA